MEFSEVATIRETLKRAKSVGIEIPESALRRWVKGGQVHAVFAGNKALIYWPTLMEFLSGQIPKQN